jgi:ABC-type nitrate/sulfonate/bicarbonate transport system substrate-binding protein
MDSLRIGTFTRSVLLDVARSSGRLAEAAIEVVETSVSSSPAQFASLRAGEFDAVFTSPDNVLAYRFLPSNPMGELLDVEILASLDRGLGLCIGARPGIVDIAELRGKKLGVDVATSGFAFVAYELLARNGLARDAYDVVALGSTPKRAEALLTGHCDATILNAGNELRSRDSGCALLGRASEIGPYLGTVVAHTRHSAKQPTVLALIDVLLSVSRDISTGNMEEEVVRSAIHVLGLTERQALQHLACMRDPDEGLVLDGLIDSASVRTLISLRQSYLPAPELNDIMAQLDRVVRPQALLR